MKKYFNLVITLVVMLFAGNSFAFTPPPAPQSGWYVSDQAGKLTAAEITSLNQKIEQVSKTTKNEFGILFLNTMDGDNIEDVAYATFNSWGIGKRGLDNGCLIVVSLTERKSRIETGKGVGGEVTDLQAKQILDNNLKPFFKKGEYAAGLHSTLDALSSLIESRHNQKPLVVSDVPSSSANGCALAAAGVGADSDGSGSLVFVLVLLTGAALVATVLVRRSNRRKQLAEAERLASEELNRQRRDRQESERRRKELERARLTVNAPISNAPPVPSRVVVPRASTILPPPVPRPTPTKTVVAATVAGVTAGAVASEAAKRLREESNRRDEENRRQRDEEDRRRRQREDDDRRRREDDDRRSSWSSSSSSSSYDSGSSSGGGFDGGSSGGGGSSSDW